MKTTPAAKRVAARTAQAAKSAKTARFRSGPFVWVSVAIALVLIGVTAAVWANATTTTSALEDLDEDKVPQNINADGGMSFGASFMPGTGNPGAPVLAVFADYTCEFCAEFDGRHSAYITDALLAEDLTYVVYPVAILDESDDGSSYSARAVNAVATVAAHAPEYSFPMHQGLTGLYSDWFLTSTGEDEAEPGYEEIAEFAKALGVPDDVIDLLDQDLYADWAVAATADFEELDFPGTPSVLVDGEFVWEWQTEGVLEQAIAQAAAAEQS